MHLRMVIGGCAVVATGLISLKTGVFDRQQLPTGPRHVVSAGSPEAFEHTGDQTIQSKAPFHGVGDGAKSGGSSRENGVTDSPYLRQLSAMLAALEREAFPDRKEEMLASLVSWIQAGDIEAALNFLGKKKSSDLAFEVQDRILQRVAEIDPEKAANVAWGLSGEGRWDSVGAVVGAWADTNLKAAVAWVDRLPEGNDKRNAVLSVAVELSRSEPETALDLVCRLPVSRERDDLIAYAAAQWATLDPSKASTWAVDVAEGPLRERLLAMIATAWGDQDPVAAASLALDTLPPGKPQSDAVVGIVQRWTQQNPESASAWVSAFPEGELRNVVVENFIKLWAQRDPRAAGDWLNTMAAGPGRDSGLRAFAEQIGPQSPRTAAKWASAITDPQMRVAQLEMTSRIWMQSDPSAARDWILKSSIPLEVRDRLLAGR